MRRVLFTVILMLFATMAFSQGRSLWPGNANVGGDFAADNMDATGTMTADYLILGASGTPIKIDVTPSLADGLIYSTTQGAYIPGMPNASVASLNDIDDVTVSTKSDGNVLAWDASESVWSATPVQSGSISSIGDIADVSTTDKISGDVLIWDGTRWDSTRPSTSMLEDVSKTVTPVHGSVMTFDSEIDKIDFANNISIPIHSAVIGQSTSVLLGDGSGISGVGATDAQGITLTGRVDEAGGIAVGRAVYINGGSGSNFTVKLADNTDEDAEHWLGVAAETRTFGQTIIIRQLGYLTGLDMSAFSDGDELYVGTAGVLTNVQPVVGSIQHVGHVKNASVSGSIIVMCANVNYVGLVSGTDYEIRLGDNIGDVTQSHFHVEAVDDTKIFSVINSASSPVVLMGVTMVVANLTNAKPFLAFEDGVISATDAPGGSGASTLAGLTDTAIVSAASGEYLQHNGVAWYNHVFNQALGDLNNVNVGSPNNSDVLTYDSALAEWSAAAGGSGSGDNPYTIVALADSPYAAIADYVCDGTEDNIQIQQAIDDLDGAGTVKILAGIYNIAVQISCATDGVNIYGNGKDTVLTRAYLETNATTTGFLYVNGDFCRVSNISFDGALASYSGSKNGALASFGTWAFIEYIYAKDCAGPGILAGCDESTILNCYVTNSGTTYGAYSISYAYRTSFIGCVAYDNNSSGFGVTGSSIGTNYISCISYENSNSGFNIVSGDENSVIGCIAHDNTYGITNGTDDGTVSNCQCWDNSVVGINVDGARGIVSGNQIHDCQTGIKIDTSCYYVKIEGNQIEGGTTGIYAANTGHYAHVSNNRVENCTDAGIKFTYSMGGYIVSNLVQGCLNWGIEIGNCNEGVDKFVVMGNIFYNNCNAAAECDLFLFATDDTIVKGNVFYSDTPDYAIILDDDAGDQCNNLLIDNNIYKGSYTEIIHHNTGHTEEPARFSEYEAANNAFILSSSDEVFVGIGTDAPIALLDVAGSVRGTSITATIGIESPYYSIASTIKIKRDVETLDGEPLTEITRQDRPILRRYRMNPDIYKPSIDQFKDLCQDVVTATKTVTDLLVSYEEGNSEPIYEERAKTIVTATESIVVDSAQAQFDRALSKWGVMAVDPFFTEPVIGYIVEELPLKYLSSDGKGWNPAIFIFEHEQAIFELKKAREGFDEQIGVMSGQIQILQDKVAELQKEGVTR